MPKTTLPSTPIRPSTKHRAPSTGHQAPSTVLILFLLLIAAACQSGPDQNQVAVNAFLEQEVAQRLALYQKVLNEKCRENVLEEAGKIADSILISEARLRRDSLDKPPRPVKPEKPDLKQLKDSLRLDPLFRDTSGDGETR